MSQSKRWDVQPDTSVRGLCVPCLDKGHQCETGNLVDGKCVCVFCEDGVPCPMDQRERKAAARQEPAPAEKESAPMPEKKCAADGCTVPLTERNQSGFCTKHIYLKYSGKTTPGRKLKAAAPPGNGHAKPRSSDRGRTSQKVAALSSGSLIVSEQQIDRMFLAWPFGDKLAAVQAFLSQQG